MAVPGRRSLTHTASVSALVLFALLLISLIVSIGTGAFSVAPNKILHIIGTETWKHIEQVDLPGMWRRFADLPGIERGLAFLDDHSGPVQTAISSFYSATISQMDNLTQPLQDWLNPEVDQRERAVVWSIRVPRTLLGAIIGAVLAVAGATMQGIFRNPLADPSLIGVSNGAALGAVAAIVFGVNWFALWTLPVFAFLAGVAITLVVYGISRHEGRAEVVTLLLAGIALNAIATALTGLLISIASDQQLRSITFWTLGSLGGSLWRHVGVVGLTGLIGLLVIWKQATALNLFALGEREARHLGVHVERTRVLLILISAGMTGAAVAFAGAISFVGLVVPHLIRLWLGPDHRRLIPLSALAGAILLVVADLASRTVVQPTEVPIGVTMSLLGGPFFIWLLIRTRRAQGSWA